MNSPLRFIATICSVFSFSNAQAEPTALVQWGSDAFSVTTDSQGQNLTSDFIFELGTFGLGFNANDSSTWASSWETVDRTTFQPDGNFFQENTLLTNENSPSNFGSQPYIWGYRTSGGIGEWILLSNPSWTWPTLANLSFPQPTRWLLRNATVTYSGTVNESNGSWTTATSEDSPPALAWNNWSALHFPGATLPDPEDDPDQDGLSNRLEYFLGSNPTEPSLPIRLDIQIETIANSPNVCITIPRSPAADDAGFSILASGNLQNWTNETSALSLISETPYQVELAQPISSTSQKFFKLEVSLDSE